MRTVKEIQQDLDKHKVHLYTDIDPLLLSRLSDHDFAEIYVLYEEMRETIDYIEFLQDKAETLQRNVCIKAQSTAAQAAILAEIKHLLGV